MVKLNFDGSSKDSGESAFGLILRNHEASTISLGYGRCGYTSAQFAEAFALREG